MVTEEQWSCSSEQAIATMHALSTFCDIKTYYKSEPTKKLKPENIPTLTPFPHYHMVLDIRILFCFDTFKNGEAFNIFSLVLFGKN